MAAIQKETKHKRVAMAVNAPRVRVRTKILSTASELFCRFGIRDVCIDRIAREAGSNKMSFYRNFSSKEELVVEFLENRQRLYWDWWDAAVAPYEGDARRQIESLISTYVQNAKNSVELGFVFRIAAVELRIQEHPGFAVVTAFYEQMRMRFWKLSLAAGANEPSQLGDALLLLFQGGHIAQIGSSSCRVSLTSMVAAVSALLNAYSV